MSNPNRALESVSGLDCATMREAYDLARDIGGRAVALRGRYMALTRREAKKLATWHDFAWITEHEGRIVTVPID